MKILRIIARLNVGGPARHVVWLTKEVQDDEFQSLLIAGTVPGGEEDMAYFAEQHGVKPIFIEEMSRELALRDVVSLYKIYRRIKQEKPDVIHTHTAKAGTVGRIAAFFYRWLTWSTLIGRPRKVFILHTFHGHVFHSYYGKLKTSVFVAIEKILARVATDKIIVISQQQFQEIHHDTGIGRTLQFVVVPLGIDLVCEGFFGGGFHAERFGISGQMVWEGQRFRHFGRGTSNRPDDVFAERSARKGRYCIDGKFTGSSLAVSRS